MMCITDVFTVLEKLLPGDGIEPPTHGFSDR